MGGVVDVPGLLRRARERARLSQVGLARASGVARTAVHGYESGRHSPTVAMLEVLLAACGLQARVELEPLRADLDLRVDALAGPVPELDHDVWSRLVASLEDRPEAVNALSRLVSRCGPVTWAVDGGAALACHGLAVAEVEPDVPEVVVALDDALRLWMVSVGLKGYIDGEGTVQEWMDVDLPRMDAALAGPRFAVLGFVRLRVVPELPTTLSCVVPWWSEPVCVVTVEEVERAFSGHAEVLARWRQRREAS